MQPNEYACSSTPHSVRDIACLATVAGLQCWQCYHYADQMRSHDLGHGYDMQFYISFITANANKQCALESILEIHELNVKNDLPDYTLPILTACVKCDQAQPRMKDALDEMRRKESATR